MFTLSLAIAFGAIAYIQIGKHWGGKRYNLYLRLPRNGEETSAAQLLNFPVRALLPKDFQDEKGMIMDIARGKKETYQLLYSFFWPLVAAWIPLAFPLAGAIKLSNILGTCVAGIAKYVFYRPELTIKAGKDVLKRLFAARKPAKALPSALPVLENSEDQHERTLQALRQELNVALFDQEESSTRVSTLQEEIFLKEARLQGSYREAALPEPEKK